MDHITIPIPEGLDETRKRSLAGWLTDLARQATAERAVFEDDPAIRAEAVRRIRRGLADADAGRICDSKEAIRRVADAHGLTPPQ